MIVEKFEVGLAELNIKVLEIQYQEGIRGPRPCAPTGFVIKNCISLILKNAIRLIVITK
jgi:hypothetical protein